LICFANGGYTTPPKCDYYLELNFFFLDKNLTYQPCSCDNVTGDFRGGSSYAQHLDCDIWVPVGFSQAAKINAGPNTISLFGRGQQADFVDLEVQCIFFPDILSVA